MSGWQERRWGKYGQGLGTPKGRKGGRGGGGGGVPGGAARRRGRGGNGNGPADPDFANVQLLLGFNGTDGQTSTVDESSFARAITFAGTAELDTAQSKFGSASLVHPVQDDFVSALDEPESSVFPFRIDSAGNSNCTIECWIRPTSLTGLTTFSCKRDSASAEEHTFFLNADKLQFIVWFAGTNILSAFQSTTLVSINEWHHVAVCKRDRDYQLYLDGVLEKEQTATNDPSANGNALEIGRDRKTVGNGFRGNVDEYRWTSGIARYNGTFTPPTAAFPRS